ncbi:MAG: BrnT family toxin [Pseudomonadota bacterium]|nr:BrnT family toxin [Pseudomonadota bacterium]
MSTGEHNTPLAFAWDPAKAVSNLRKHGVAFAQAATVLADPLALTVFDAAHSTQEDRWFTLGLSRQRTLLAVAHTYVVDATNRITVRIISARPATSRERQQYEHTPR